MEFTVQVQLSDIIISLGSQTYYPFFYYARMTANTVDLMNEEIIHTGGCHCKNIRWEVKAPASVVAWKCNCTNCSLRGNTNFVVPSSKFKLIEDSSDFITTYTFGTHTAKHTFCKVCGITSFYTPRSNPDGISVTVNCVDPGTISHVEYKYYDGRNWEKSYDQMSISACSKEAN